MGGELPMVASAWLAFDTELDRWRDEERFVEFWWRDDDACRPDPALSRLYALAYTSDIPLALAAIPEMAQKAAFDGLPAHSAVIQHGTDHRNRAAPGEKKTEFSTLEPVDSALGRLLTARKKLEKAADGRLLPVLAPPWNRVPLELARRLGESGYQGLSTFGVTKVTNPSPSLRQLNTHVDVIDWKGNRGFCGDEEALGQAIRHLADRREGKVAAGEPVGWLTHHAVHDEACWEFLDRLFDVTRNKEGVVWRSPASLFSAHP
jgi:hypothetical protein